MANGQPLNLSDPEIKRLIANSYLGKKGKKGKGDGDSDDDDDEDGEGTGKKGGKK